MSDTHINAYDNAPAFCQAIDMWKVHALDPRTERLFSDVLSSICWMGACLLTKQKEFAGYRILFLSADIQAALVLHALEKTRVMDIDTAHPKRAVNYYVNMAQNYLRDLADKCRRRKDFQRIDKVDPDTASICSDLFGERRKNHNWKPELLAK